MKKVLTVMDEDAHMHVFDLSTPEKETTIFKAMLTELLDEDYLFDKTEATQQIKKLLAQKAVSADDFEEFAEEFTQVSFDRSGGGKMYICEIEDNWNSRLLRTFY
jgi:nitrogen regulatory protein PII